VPEKMTDTSTSSTSNSPRLLYSAQYLCPSCSLAAYKHSKSIFRQISLISLLLRPIQRYAFVYAKQKHFNILLLSSYYAP
jgi:hypothetical protein